MDDATYLKLSTLLRERWEECVRSLDTADGTYGEADYDAVIWGNPHDWPETESSTQETLACILYQPQEQPKLPPPPPKEYPCVFLEYLDGAFSVKSNPGTGWKNHEQESFVPFNERMFHKKRAVYADNLDQNAVWILVGDKTDEAYCPKVRAGLIRHERMTPDAMAGVVFHADLTWDALEFQFIMKDERRLIRLPEWGLRSYLQQVDPLFTGSEDLRNVHSLLTGKATRFRISEDKQEEVTPNRLEIDVYINKLRHIIPRLPEKSMRLTGWFCSELLQDSIDRLFEGRCRAIEFGYPYRTMNFAEDTK